MAVLPEVKHSVAEWMPDMQALLLPIRLGNVIRCFERYPFLVYGMDGIVFWPGLVSKIDSGFAAWGVQVRSAFDLYRSDLLEGLGSRQNPLTYQEEHALGFHPVKIKTTPDLAGLTRALLEPRVKRSRLRRRCAFWQRWRAWTEERDRFTSAAVPGETAGQSFYVSAFGLQEGRVKLGAVV